MDTLLLPRGAPMSCYACEIINQPSGKLESFKETVASLNLYPHDPLYKLICPKTNISKSHEQAKDAVKKKKVRK